MDFIILKMQDSVCYPASIQLTPNTEVSIIYSLFHLVKFTKKALATKVDKKAIIEEKKRLEKKHGKNSPEAKKFKEKVLLF